MSTAAVTGSTPLFMSGSSTGSGSIYNTSSGSGGNSDGDSPNLLFLLMAESSTCLADADWSRWVVPIGGFLLILWFWAAPLADYCYYSDHSSDIHHGSSSASTSHAMIADKDVVAGSIAERLGVWATRHRFIQPTSTASPSFVVPTKSDTNTGIDNVYPTKDDNDDDDDESETATVASSLSCSTDSPEEVELSARFPQSTRAERERFLDGKSYNVDKAAQQLETYLQWHYEHQAIAKQLDADDNNNNNNNDDDDDLQLWNRACRIATKSRAEPTIRTLPRIIRNNDKVRDQDGVRVLQVLPALIDGRLAKPSTYGLAIALYMDALLDRHSRQRCTVLLDVRSGQGWPNVPAARQLGFVQEVTSLLLTMFPERLHKCLLCPLPGAFAWVWNLVRRVLDPATANKFRVFSGGVKYDADLPELDGILGPEDVELLEQQRKALFVESK